MDETNFAFCPHCGARVPSDAVFCNECGTSLNNYNPGAGCCSVSKDPLSTPALLTMLYGIFVTLFGMLSVVMGLTVTPELWAEMLNTVPDFETLYPGITAQGMRDLFIWSGVYCLVGGLTPLGAYVLMRKRIYHMIAMVLLVIASFMTFFVFGVFGVFCMAIGLYMTYQVYKNKDLFSS